MKKAMRSKAICLSILLLVQVAMALASVTHARDLKDGRNLKACGSVGTAFPGLNAFEARVVREKQSGSLARVLGAPCVSQDCQDAPSLVPTREKEAGALGVELPCLSGRAASASILSSQPASPTGGAGEFKSRHMLA
jgi:hypothetical protein